VANTLKLSRNGAVGFIGWLDGGVPCSLAWYGTLFWGLLALAAKNDPRADGRTDNSGDRASGGKKGGRVINGSVDDGIVDENNEHRADASAKNAQHSPQPSQHRSHQMRDTI
jgi:hypothetical protein